MADHPVIAPAASQRHSSDPARPTAGSATAAAAAPPAPAAGPLSPEHLALLAEGRRRTRKVRRAAGYATASGWTLVVFAALTFTGVLFGDFVSLAIAVALAVLGANELRGGAELRRFDAGGARRLAFNQLGLGVLIVAYASWSLVVALRDPALAGLQQSTGDAGIDEMVGQIANLVTYGVYGGLAVVGVVVPGLTAWYYHSRGRIVRAALAETPSWVIDAMRATSG
ncbi:MAG: hypothetical protein KDA22_12740 [Phycisphaerales bacterium]|nr:hypothetical protein [Phycisphaerales bacterium]